MKRSRKMIAAGIALTLALGGGAAYAASEGSSSPAPSAADQQTNKTGKGEMKGKFAAGKSGKIAIHPKQQLSAAAAALGMEEESVRTELKAGKSLADLAKEKGVAVDTVIAALAKDAEENIDKLVEAGKLTAEQAATAKQKAAEQAKQAVEQTGFADFGGGRGHGFGPGGKHMVGGLGINAPLDKIAEIVGLSVEDLQKELEADKSIADIALEKGVAVDTVIAALAKDAEEKIDKLVEAGKLTAEQAATAKQKAAEQAKQAVEQTGFADFGGGRGHGFGPGGKHMVGGLGINAPLDKIAEIVGLSVEDLQKELEADKSIADIALEKGISKDQLIVKLQELTKPALEKFVDHKGGFKGKVMKKKDAAAEQPTATE